MNKLFTVTRRDLSLGQQTAQTAHAVGEASINLYRNGNFNTFIQTTHVVCLTVENEFQMHVAIKKLNKIMNMHINKFHEPDLKNQLTSISFIAHENMGKLLKKELFAIGIDLKLVGDNTNINKKDQEVSMCEKQKQEVAAMKGKLNFLEQRLNDITGIIIRS